MEMIAGVTLIAVGVFMTVADKSFFTLMFTLVGALTVGMQIAGPIEVVHNGTVLAVESGTRLFEEVGGLDGIEYAYHSTDGDRIIIFCDEHTKSETIEVTNVMEWSVGQAYKGE